MRLPIKAQIRTYTVSQKKRTNFETVQLEIIRFDFDDICQKYSKYSRTEYACFSFRVGLLFYQLFANSILDYFEYFWQMPSKSNGIISYSSYTISNLVRFFLRHSVEKRKVRSHNNVR